MRPDQFLRPSHPAGNLIPQARGILRPILWQAAFLIAMGTLIIVGLRLDEWAAAEALECRASARAAFCFQGQSEVSWQPFRPFDAPVNTVAGNGAPKGHESTEADVPTPEPWLFLRLTGPDSKLHRFIRVHVTGYTSCPTETNCMPHITASSTLTAPGTIALSRDLLRTFTPGAPFDFGDKILIPGVGVFEVWDTMNARWRKRADIWFEHKEEAREWGIREVFVTLVSDEAPTMAWRPRQFGQ